MKQVLGLVWFARAPFQTPAARREQLTGEEVPRVWSVHGELGMHRRVATLLNVRRVLL